MKKVVAFVGSPRKNGNTALLVQAVAQGAAEVPAQVEVYYLNDMQIKPCQSCFDCRETGVCSIEDELQPVYEKIKAADAIVIGSPIYMLQVCAQTKILFDRLLPLIGDGFQPRFGTKKTVLVYSMGNADLESVKPSLAVNDAILAVMGLNVVNTIIVTGANNPQAAAADEQLIERARHTGRQLLAASSLRL